MQISVVIPTCNRKPRLLSLLQNLDNSIYPLDEVIIVDSGDERLEPAEYTCFPNLRIQYIHSERSVCIQRNTGIRMARSAWILLCDDDIEIGADYLQKLVNHVQAHPEAGAVSGLWLEKVDNEWKSTHPVHSARMLFWKYIFQLGIWGEIKCDTGNFITRKIRRFYERMGNHISIAGWPVNTDFTGEFSICPVYSLGASLVRKEWLIHSPFDEVLDRHGIGDNYGVIVDFPVPAVHIVNKALIYHHHEPANRLKRSLQYYRRLLALDYYVRTKQSLKYVKKSRIFWSLTGNLLEFIRAGDSLMARATLKAMRKIVFNSNPYYLASLKKIKVTEPML